MIKARFLTVLLAAATAVGCTSAAGQTATSAAITPAQTARLMVWSVNSDGPDFRAILTGTVGDYGPGVTVYPDGAVDPDHTSELELKLSQGSFRLSIAALDATLAHAISRWPYSQATCSIDGSVSGTAPIVAGSGTGAYRGVAGTFTLTISLDEDYVKGPACSETTGFTAQFLAIEGTGSLRR